MFGRKTLGVVAMTGALAANACGARSQLEDGVYDNPKTTVTGSDAGVGGSETGGGGNGGETGTGGDAGKGGEAGSGGEGGTLNCSLVKNLVAVPDVFNPINGEISTVSFEVAQKLSALKLEIDQTQSGVPLRTLLNLNSVLPGQMQASWDGKDKTGVLVPNGTYFAKLITTTPECSDVKGVFVTVKNAIKNCTLDVSQHQGDGAKTIAVGTPKAEMACYDFKAGECPVAVEALGITKVGAGAVDYLSNNALYIGSNVVSPFKNFSSVSQNVVFDAALGINVPAFGTETVCLKSDISSSSGAFGNQYQMLINSKADVTAFAQGAQLTDGQISGNFPVKGPVIFIGN